MNNEVLIYYHYFVTTDIVQSSLVLLVNEALREIDLSSLEEVIGGGIVAFANNPSLCFSGNLSHFSQQPNCIVNYKKADSLCCKFLWRLSIKGFKF